MAANKFSTITSQQVVRHTLVRRQLIRAIIYQFSLNFFLVILAIVRSSSWDGDNSQVGFGIAVFTWNIAVPWIWIYLSTFIFWNKFVKYHKIDRKVKFTEVISKFKLRNYVQEIAGMKDTELDTKGFVELTQEHMRVTYIGLVIINLVPVLLSIPTFNWIIMGPTIAIAGFTIIFAFTYHLSRIKYILTAPNFVFDGVDSDMVLAFAKKPLTYKA